MKIIDHNFVPVDTAKRIMESYGYAAAEVEEQEVTEVPEESSEETGSICVYEHDTGVYQLNSEVETINDGLYISVSEISDADQVALAESDAPSLETVDFEDTSYTLGDIFETPDGETFVSLTPDK
tara:strand:- start:234 stop:608 length:375 start_codon:yes stop_codon:yes gene_type:complete